MVASPLPLASWPTPTMADPVRSPNVRQAALAGIQGELRGDVVGVDAATGPVCEDDVALLPCDAAPASLQVLTLPCASRRATTGAASGTGRRDRDDFGSVTTIWDPALVIVWRISGVTAARSKAAEVAPTASTRRMPWSR